MYCIASHFRLACVFLFAAILLIQSYSSAFGAELLLAVEGNQMFSRFAGKNLCYSINKKSDNSCTLNETKDFVDILTNMSSGAYDLALINSKSMFDAVHGRQGFQYTDIRYDDLRMLVPLYEVPVVFITRKNSGIKSMDDLPGKRVNGGAPFSMTSSVFNTILDHLGWNRMTFQSLLSFPSHTIQVNMAMRNGTLDSALYIGMHPDLWVARELAENRITLMGISEKPANSLVNSGIGFCKCRIPGNTYENTADFETIGLEIILVVSADMEDELVADILESIYTDKKRLQKTHHSFLHKEVTKEYLNAGCLPPHPAAVQFFQ